jgi:hypothetical protein
MRKSFGRRLRDMVEQQQVQQQALEQVQQQALGGEEGRELQQLVQQAQMKQVLQKIMHTCEAGMHLAGQYQPGEVSEEDQLPRVLGAVCKLLQELPLSLAHESIDELLQLVVAEGIKLEEQQITQLRRAVEASHARQMWEGGVQQLQQQVVEVEGRAATATAAHPESDSAIESTATGSAIGIATAENMAETAAVAAMAEIQQELQPLVQQLEEMRKEEMAEQAAVGRNLEEFNRLNSFCSSEQDKLVHGRVQQKIVEIGSQKWRAARAVQAPTAERIQKLREREAVLQAQLDCKHQQREEQVVKVVNLQYQLQAMQLEANQAAIAAHRQAVLVEEVQQRAQRLQMVVKALQGTQQQLQQVWGVVWGK